MEQSRVEQRGLLSIQAADYLGWRRLDIERLHFTRDGIQAIEGSAVVMLVVALDETGRHAVQRPGTTEEGGDAIFHWKPPLGIENMSSMNETCCRSVSDQPAARPARGPSAPYHAARPPRTYRASTPRCLSTV